MKPRRYLVEFSCLMCGTVAGQGVAETNSSPVRLMTMPRCEHCGSQMVQESDRQSIPSSEPAWYEMEEIPGKRRGRPPKIKHMTASEAYELAAIENPPKQLKQRVLCIGSDKMSHSGMCLTCGRAWPKLPHSRAFSLPRHFVKVAKTDEVADGTAQEVT